MKHWKKYAGVLAAALMVWLTAMTVLAAEYRYLDTPADVRWTDTMGVGRWDRVSGANRYEVRLYEGEYLVKRVYVTRNQVDLKEYMSEGQLYFFSVRAVPDEGEKRVKDSEWASSEAVRAEGLGDTEGRWRNYVGGSKYQFADGTYASGGWQMIRGIWYYFNTEGYVQTGWQRLDGKWYYLEEDGAMATGWKELDGSWYYLNPDGSMATGWVEGAPGQWYYLDESGRMLTNTVVDGCQLDASGLWME